MIWELFVIKYYVRLMGTKLSGPELKLYKAIDEILWNDWDPIGINESNNRDEYYSYIPAIYELVMSGSNKELIAEKLSYYETVEMGALGSKEKCLIVARKIIDTCNQIFD